MLSTSASSRRLRLAVGVMFGVAMAQAALMPGAAAPPAQAPNAPQQPPLITKYVQPGEGVGIARGSTIAYTLVVTAQATPLTDVVVSDLLPTGASLIPGSASGSGVVSGTNPIQMSQPALGAGGVATLTFQVRVDESAAANTVISNTASVAAAGEPSQASNVVSHVVRVPATVTLSVAPDSQVAGGPGSPVTVTVSDENGDPIFGQVVTATVSPAARGTLSAFGPTNANGQATATWTPGTGSGAGTITAYADGATATAAITVTPGPTAAVNVTATPGTIVANGVSTATVTAQVVDQFGNGVPGQSVAFFTNVGVISPPGGTTDANGVATTTLTSAAMLMAATVQATSSGVTGSTVVQFGPPEGQFTGVFTATPSVSVTAGSLITYTFVLTNTGPSQNNVGMIATVPEGTEVVSVVGGVYANDVATLRSILPSIADVNAVAWTGNLMTGESHTIVYTVRVNQVMGTLTADAFGVVDAVEIFSSPDVTTAVIPRTQLFLPFISRQ